MASPEFLAEFDSLSAKRQRFLDSIQENNLEGLLTQLTEIYPDEAHFIYELLQNAEDAEATEVFFLLTNSLLAFRHNGTRPFSITDIEAITNYGNSTKKIETNKIGKFGVGFKSVFAYTSKPIINSNGFTFSITQTTLPSREMVDQNLESTFRDDVTTFIFNFDEPSKPRSQAYQEIQQGLKDLDERALLFLSNIKKIEIRYANDQKRNRVIEKSVLEQNKVGFVIREAENERLSHFLLLRGRMPQVSLEALDDSVRNRVSQLSVGIAFALKRNTEEKFEIVPIDNANVCVYFPAVKEDSGLKFHIHAPFASTPSRDVIRMTAENRAIVDGISNLLLTNLDSLKRDGYLGEGFLSAMPNSTDRINPMYEVFREKISTIYKSDKEYLPLSNDSFVSYKKAIVANAQIQNAIGPYLLGELLRFSSGVPSEGYKYLPIYRNQRAQQFVSSLGIASLSFTEIRNLLRSFIGGNRPDSLNSALSSLTQEQLKNFFLLFEMISRESLQEIKELPFIPLNNQLKKFGSPSETFLPSKTFQDNENMVSSVLVDPANPNDQMVRSLQNLGLRILDDWAMLDLNISKLAKIHRAGDPVNPDDLKTAFSSFQEYARAVGKDAERIRKISALNIFIGIDQEGRPFWTSLDDVYVDLPFKASGLESISQYLPKKYKLWERYVKSPEIGLFIENSKSLTRIIPEKIVLTNGAFDWKIDNFEEMLESGDEIFLQSIWDMLIEPRNEQLRWEVRAQKASSGFLYSESSFIGALTYSAWVPCIDGKKRRPTNVSNQTLTPKFRFRETSYTKAIKFDGSSQEALMRERAEARLREEKNELAKELGFIDYTEVELLQKIKKLQPDILKNLIASMENHFPEETVEDFEESLLTATKSIGNAEEVKIVENVIRERKNYKTNHVLLKEYLKSAYSLDGHIKCQICNLFMPFQLLNGEDYFEAVYLLRSLPKEIKQNGLALCPVCAAKYKYTLKTTPSQLITFIKDAEVLGTGSVSIQVEIGRSISSITFTDEHMTTMKGILKEAK